jgi:hypothetical protein
MYSIINLCLFISHFRFNFYAGGGENNKSTCFCVPPKTKNKKQSLKKQVFK